MSKDKGKENQEAGTCPRCESVALDYSPLEVHSDQIMYPYECNDCGFLGREWYNLVFVEHRDSTGKEIPNE